MATPINDNFEVRAPKSLDKRYSNGSLPYTSIAAAHAAIPYKAIGLPMIIGSSNADFDLYWYKGGITQDDIVPVISIGIAEVNGLQTALNTKQPDLGFTPVPTTRLVNGKSLAANITLNTTDIGLANVPNVDATNASNLSSGTIPIGRYGSAQIPTSAINATGGSSNDFLSKGGVWKQPDNITLTFSNKFVNTGTSTAPIIDLSPVFGFLPTYTTTQKNALTGMTTNSVVIDTTIGAIQRWNGSAWV